MSAPHLRHSDEKFVAADVGLLSFYISSSSADVVFYTTNDASIGWYRKQKVLNLSIEDLSYSALSG